MFPPESKNMRGSEDIEISTRGRQTAAEIGWPNRLNAASELNPLPKRVVNIHTQGTIAEEVALPALLLLQKALVKPCITPLGTALRARFSIGVRGVEI